MTAADRSEDACAHEFVRFRRWPVKDRYRCTLCGFVTRHYDGLDRTMYRPVHPHMSVAVVGFNATRRRQSGRDDASVQGRSLPEGFA